MGGHNRGKLRIGALISGGGSNLQAIIDGCENQTIDGRMVFVGTDNPDAFGLLRAKKHYIPTFVVDYSEIIRRYRQRPDTFVSPSDLDEKDAAQKNALFSETAPDAFKRRFILTRAVAEAALIEAMKPYPFDLLVLAGFMRTLTPYFIDRVNQGAAPPRIMNIHPALLPAFPGTDGYGDTFRYGCKIGGCTVHFVDYGEDTGPIIGQKAYEIKPEDTLDDIKKRGLELEWQLYPECIQLYAGNRLKLERGKYRKNTMRTVVIIC